MARNILKIGFRWWVKPSLYAMFPVAVFAPRIATSVASMVIDRGLYLK